MGEKKPAKAYGETYRCVVVRVPNTERRGKIAEEKDRRETSRQWRKFITDTPGVLKKFLWDSRFTCPYKHYTTVRRVQCWQGGVHLCKGLKCRTRGMRYSFMRFIDRYRSSIVAVHIRHLRLAHAHSLNRMEKVSVVSTVINKVVGSAKNHDEIRSQIFRFSYR